MTNTEISGLRLVSYHNVYFYMRLMQRIRWAIDEDRFGKFHDDFLKTYQTNELSDEIKV